MPGTATLADLDNFLRRIWLECCGHLSEFVINGVRYSEDTGMDDHWDWGWDDYDTESIDTRIQDVLAAGTRFS